MQDKEKEKTTEELEKQLSGLGRLSDYLAENAENNAIFEYPKAERLVTDDGRSFFDS